VCPPPKTLRFDAFELVQALHPSQGGEVVRNLFVTLLEGGLGLVLAWALLGCGQQDAREMRAHTSWPWCRVKGIARAVRCQSLEVSSGDGAGPGASVFVVVVPAESDEPKPDPVVFLAGGPGQSATEAYGPMLPLYTKSNRDRDLVLIDVRGTEHGSPMYCVPDAEDDAAELEEIFRVSGITRGAEKCLGQLDSDELDARKHITTKQFVKDLEAVRKALDAETWNLVGASYGTRLAMQYAKAHPDRTRSLVLDAVAPAQLELPLPFARDMESALDEVAQRCREEKACLEANGDPLERLKGLMGSLPKRVEVTHPRTGLRREVDLTKSTLAQLTRPALYATALQGMLPYAVRRAEAGDLSPLLGQTALMEQGGDLSLGVLLSVTCAEDLPRIAPEEIGPATEGTVMGDTVVRDFMQACELWEVPPSPLDLGPLPPSIPVLTLSGTVDPVTPVRWADIATEGVEHRHRVIMPHAGHGILARGCVPRLVDDYLDAPKGTLDASCVEDSEAPAFFLSQAGAAP